MANKVSLFLFVVSAVCSAAYLYLCFQTGCAGDLKTAALGNIPRAMELSKQAQLFFMLALATGITASALRTTQNLIQRIANILIFVVIALILLSYFGVALETKGVQSCF